MSGQNEPNIDTICAVLERILSARENTETKVTHRKRRDDERNPEDKTA